MESILPTNATPQELALEAVGGEPLEDSIFPIRDLWNPDKCPANLLYLLAWAVSVDEWRPEWTEAEKRQAIKNNWSIHAHKGTIGALKAALAVLNMNITVTEWFKMQPAGAAYTFDVEVRAEGRAISEELYSDVSRIINAAKNARSKMVGINIISEVSGPLNMAAFLAVGQTIEILPEQ